MKVGLVVGTTALRTKHKKRVMVTLGFLFLIIFQPSVLKGF